jgi:hypothetical protein
MAEIVSRGVLEDKIRTAAMEDAEYRQALIDDPKATLSKEMGEELPADLEVKTIEETGKVIYLTVPEAMPQSGDELSEDDLQKVAGGFLDTVKNCKAGNALSMASIVNVKLG